ncbi:MAG: hypothetical protein JSR46_02670 [Verrucomicrobia bacterium]|nr:hypothetical protein [Verrucomicrobiota bacterium]
MCLLDEIVPSQTSVSDFFASQTTAVVNHLLQLPAQIIAFGKNVVTDLTKIARSAKGLSETIRFVEDSVRMIDLAQQAEAVARPIFDAASNVTSFRNAGRIFESISYLVDGSFYKDVIEVNVLPLISAISFFMRRCVATASWLFSHNVLDRDALAQVAEKVGIAPVFSHFSRVLPAVSEDQFLDGTLVAGLIPIVIMHGEKLVKGEDIVYNFLECTSAVADTVGAILRLSSIDDPYIQVPLSLVAAGTGFFAFFADPANTKTKDPFTSQ